MIPMEVRRNVLVLVSEAIKNGARKFKCCEILELPARTIQRWEYQLANSGSLEDQRAKAASYRVPVNKLSNEEQDRIIEVCNQQEYADLPPSQIVPRLADKGLYIASESTFYRVLHDNDQVNHRGLSLPKRKVGKPKALRATKPNEIWSWDITYLRSNIKGEFFYLYLFMDIFSRKIVGWEIYNKESANHSSRLMIRTCLAEGIAQDQITLHSDNGGPMKGSTFLATLQMLGVVPSFSRPGVSDDNPYSESLFRTLKYSHDFPRKPFESLEVAREWVKHFVAWYNDEHKHSGINFVSPSDRHTGKDKEILKKRDFVYKQAKAKFPERWSKETRNWEYKSEVLLNPDKEIIMEGAVVKKETA